MRFFVLCAILLVNGHAVAADAAEKAAVCAACHGQAGVSINPEWPNLAGQHAKYIKAQLQHFRDNVRVNANMNGIAMTLSDEDIELLAGYYSKLPAGVGTADPVLVEAGEALYRGGNAATGVPACMACHGPNGAGNGPANYPALSGQHAKYTTLQLTAYRDGTRAGWPAATIMQGISAKLSDTEIEALSAYIQGLY